MPETLPPNRSCLYMPASNLRALEKAKSLPADTIILDLEDSVAPESKDDAREQACAALAEGGYGHRQLVVRINAPDTPWYIQDLKTLCASEADAILVPKIGSAHDVMEICDFMDQEDVSIETQLWLMIEMPLAVLNLAEISALGPKSRLTTLVLGFNDLAKEMQARPDATRLMFHPIMAKTVMAARAHDLQVLDSVYNDFRDHDGLRRECRQASDFGFDGKTLIHPSQIDIANEVFAPGEDELAEAEAIIEAFENPVNAGKGVITVDGKMTELLHLHQARKLVAKAENIARLQS